jgi:hypothetical protein
MSEDKMKLPAAIRFETEGVLDPVEINWLHIMQVCTEGLQKGQLYVILPVEAAQDYKPQRRRLITDDKTSPNGLIQRDEKARKMYYPYAAARFDIAELGKYAAEKFNNMSRDDLARMADEIVNSGGVQ